MKQIMAIIKRHRLEQVEGALHQLDHLSGFTLTPARGHGRGSGANHAYVATEWLPDQHENFVLIMFCADDTANEVVETIRTAAYTGVPGDGMVAILPIDSVVRIRTGERDNAAV